jgi:hypothetical protein
MTGDRSAGEGVKWVEVPPGSLKGQGLAPYDVNASKLAVTS